MRHAILIAISAGILSFATPSVAASSARYVAPSGAFSISMEDFADRGFSAGVEKYSADMSVVDFPHHNSMGLTLFWGRTVEWIKLDKPIDPAQYDSQATDIAAGYLDGRFGAGQFAIADRGKFRDGEGRLVYAFAAKGQVQQMPAAWQGAVLFFTSGAALVSEVVPGPTTGHFESKGGVVNRSLVDWAVTLRPEK